MKESLDWQSSEIVNIYDEVNLWSAPFGRLLLENIPMKRESKVLDIGFGTGFPLIELSQRFGKEARIYGMDIWEEAIKRTREKIRVLGLTNIEIFEQSAEKIPLPDNELDLICSNLGINNFGNKDAIYFECHRVLKRNGSLCISTNPAGTFSELYNKFSNVIDDMRLVRSVSGLKDHIDHRGTERSIIAEIEITGFRLSKKANDESVIRFAEPEALFDHGLIRTGFLEEWKKLIPPDNHEEFFMLLLKKIESEINRNGEFIITIPVLYLEFRKV
ncbi:MAG TPA: class I SAM-dependent methyltransferase [Ignavibacteria bacterium]|nr:class I SAM-dependent methyltransferase [Ignavibacteria bacterium]HMR41127.1 class I SAM-dependent methyltransferase [Ignavibacteria bacterium]